MKTSNKLVFVVGVVSVVVLCGFMFQRGLDRAMNGFTTQLQDVQCAALFKMEPDKSKAVVTKESVEVNGNKEVKTITTCRKPEGNS